MEDNFDSGWDTRVRPDRQRTLLTSRRRVRTSVGAQRRGYLRRPTAQRFRCGLKRLAGKKTPERDAAAAAIRCPFPHGLLPDRKPSESWCDRWVTGPPEIDLQYRRLGRTTCH